MKRFSILSKHRFILLASAALYFLIINYFYYQRIAAFGCFDDCFNYGAGYFITEGKKIYTDLFFNHMPLMAYISAFIQSVFQPETLYHFLLIHRLFVIGFSMIINILLVYRFGYAGLGFLLLYEPTKFYVFGDRFLAEGLIVYCIVFLAGTAFHVIQKKKITSFDLLLSTIFTWFIVFSREPFIPVAIVLFGILLIHLFKKSFLYLGIFLLLSCITVFYHSFSDFWYNVYYLNLDRINGPDGPLMTVLKAAGYPVYVLVAGNLTFFKIFLIGNSILFLFLNVVLLKVKEYKLFLFILSILFLANLRVVPPDAMYYETFHLAPWYGLIIFTNTFLLYFISKYLSYKRLIVSFCIVFCSMVVWSLLSPQAFFHEKIDRNFEFTTNYSHFYVAGDIFKTLARPGDTLFVDGFDELIHQQADIQSPYKYSWYTSFMPRVAKYKNAREEMFVSNPPSLYYGDCPTHPLTGSTIPHEMKDIYVNIAFDNSISCLYVHKDKLKGISSQQRTAIKRLGFSLPESL